MVDGNRRALSVLFSIVVIGLGLAVWLLPDRTPVPVTKLSQASDAPVLPAPQPLPDKPLVVERNAPSVAIDDVERENEQTGNVVFVDLASGDPIETGSWRAEPIDIANTDGATKALAFTSTDDDVALDAGTWRVESIDNAWHLDRALITIEADETTRVHVSAAAPFAVQVVDELTGTPIGHADVLVATSANKTWFADALTQVQPFRLSSELSRTDAQGFLHITPTHYGPVDISVVAPGRQPASRRLVPHTARGTVVIATSVAKPALSVKLVCGMSSQPIVGALANDSIGPVSSLSDGTGSLHLIGERRARYCIFAAPGYVPLYAYTPALTAGATIKLQPAATLHWKVTSDTLPVVSLDALTTENGHRHCLPAWRSTGAREGKFEVPANITLHVRAVAGGHVDVQTAKVLNPTHAIHLHPDASQGAEILRVELAAAAQRDSVEVSYAAIGRRLVPADDGVALVPDADTARRIIVPALGGSIEMRRRDGDGRTVEASLSVSQGELLGVRTRAITGGGELAEGVTVLVEANTTAARSFTSSRRDWEPLYFHPEPIGSTASASPLQDWLLTSGTYSYALVEADTQREILRGHFTASSSHTVIDIDLPTRKWTEVAAVDERGVEIGRFEIQYAKVDPLLDVPELAVGRNGHYAGWLPATSLALKFSAEGFRDEEVAVDHDTSFVSVVMYDEAPQVVDVRGAPSDVEYVILSMLNANNEFIETQAAQRVGASSMFQLTDPGSLTGRNVLVTAETALAEFAAPRTRGDDLLAGGVVELKRID